MVWENGINMIEPISEKREHVKKERREKGRSPEKEKNRRGGEMKERK